MDIVGMIEGTSTDENDRPIQDVVIQKCGILPVDKPYLVNKEPISCH